MTGGPTGPEGLSAEKESEVRASFARQGLMRTIGAELAALGPGRCTVEVPFSERVGQQQGFFHGGVIGAVADTAGGYAALSLLPFGSEVVTLQVQGQFPQASRRRSPLGRGFGAPGGALRDGDPGGRVRRGAWPEEPLRRATAEHHEGALAFDLIQILTGL